LTSRLRRLEGHWPKAAVIPGVASDWQKAAAMSPEARQRAVVLTARIRELWPEREPTSDEFLEDPICLEHFLYLECLQAGGLANWLAPVLDDSDENLEKVIN
jgi:hypothetical protein